MAPDQAFPLLAALLVLPAVGAAVVALSGGRDRLGWRMGAGVAALTLALAIWAVVDPPSEPERYPWIPSLGVSLVLAADIWGSCLVAWVALASTIALATTRPDAKSAALLLSLHALTTGLLLAGDTFVALACLGGGAVVMARLTSVPENVLTFAATGLTLLVGWFARYFHLVYEQTGFLSTELAWWQSLALYPREEQSLFVNGALGVALLLPSYAIAIENGPRAHRLFLYATAGVMGGFFVSRVLVPLAPVGATATASWALGVAVVLMLWAALARGWTLLAVGYQGLILYGVFSMGRSDAAAPELVMLAGALGFFGLALTTSRALVWASVSVLVAVPALTVLVPAWRATAFPAFAGTLAFVLMALAFVRVAKRAPDGAR